MTPRVETHSIELYLSAPVFRDGGRIGEGLSPEDLAAVQEASRELRRFGGVVYPETNKRSGYRRLKLTAVVDHKPEGRP